MHQPAARHGQIGFRGVKLPSGFGQQSGIASKHGSLVEQSRLPDPLIHAVNRLPIRAWLDSGTTPQGWHKHSEQGNRIADRMTLPGAFSDS
jgi:hypothetical protein